nr:triple gene block protein 1 [Elm carlavirus]
MNSVLDVLCEFGFSRISISSERPLVVHCVPGAGKSTAIRSILRSCENSVAYTFGVCDPAQIEGCRIRSASEWHEPNSGTIVIVDEYTEGDFKSLKPTVVFGDPCQAPVSAITLKPHFICKSTKRFGKETCNLLRSLGYEINSEKGDTLVHEPIFEGELEGVIVAFESDVKHLLAEHYCEFLDICEIRGKTFEVVTFVTSTEGKPVKNLEKYYQCLTRHSSKLKILSPDASFASS